MASRIPMLNRCAVAALLLFTAATVRAQDDGPDVLYQQGLQLFFQGEYGQAVPRFRTLLEQFGQEPELKQALERVHYALGSAYYNQQQFAESIEAFENYVRLYPEAKFRAEALFRIAAALQAGDDYGKAVDAYRRLVTDTPESEFAEDAQFQIGVCHLLAGAQDKAIEAFETFGRNYPESSLLSQALMLTARAQFDRNESVAALDTLDRIDSAVRSLDHIAYVNFLAMETGDRAFDETDYDLALRAYRRVRTRESLLRLQQRHVTELRAELQSLERRQGAPQDFQSRFREERRLRNTLSAAEDLLQRIEGLPEYDAGLFHRIGSCFMSTDRFWEARVAFQRVVAEAKEKTIREAAQFDLILVLSRLRRFDDLVREADSYLAAYREDPALRQNGRVPSVAFMRAESYVNQERFEEAEGEMVTLREEFPDHAQRDRIDFYVALSRTLQEKFAQGIEDFEAWLEANRPENPLRAEVEYWLPIAFFYDGQYARALPQFQQYVERYPASVYAPEAAYRAALCKYSMEDFEGSGRDLRDWMTNYPDHYFRWEAAVTCGDALAAAGRLEEAKEVYNSVPTEAGPFYFLALTQVSKVYKALGTETDFRDMAAVYARYIQNNPTSPNVVDAAYQAGWALRQIGRPEEAQKLYWNVVRQYGNNREWEGFSPLLKDLRALYTGTDGGAVLDREFDQELEKAAREKRPTLAARLSQFRLPVEPPSRRLEAVLDFAENFPPEVLGAEGLAFLGDFMLEQGRTEKGMSYLDRLLQEFPGSRYVAIAHVRRAEQMNLAGDYENALLSAQSAVERAQEPDLFLRALYARAESRRGLGSYDGAVEDYNAVLANRGGPRELKPGAMLGIAAAYEARKDFRKAIPYYQRIYVLYGAYPEAVAIAYLRSGRAFEEMKDWDAAANTYREMLANDTINTRPEAEEARVRLSKLQT